ncbi:glycosyl hydrolase family 7-domain-containing protein [Favolaschia claudopus]|uniref:Glucanase n=1 Tax=Favolaschia claudopus TaxID=2862362 RepID=A0AAW0CCL2_9AGAR
MKTAVGDTNSFAAHVHGGLETMGAALKKGMVLALSIWDDYEANMLWLDSDYPTNASATAPGVSRGPCSATSGDPKTVESTETSDYVIFSDIKLGALGSTFSNTGSSSPPPSGPGSTTTTAPQKIPAVRAPVNTASAVDKAG